MSQWPIKDPLGNEIHLPPLEGVISHAANIDRLLMAVAKFMWEGDAGEWVDNCFVSDMSSLGDFGLENAEIEKLGKELGLELKQQDLLMDIAMRMERQ